MKDGTDNKQGLYRSRKGMIFGVCGGIAEFFDFSTFWVRAGAVLLLMVSGLWPVLGIYLLAAVIMKPSPVCPIHNEEERGFYDSYARSPGEAAHRLKHQFENLDRRIRRMEDVVTARAYEWDQKFSK